MSQDEIADDALAACVHDYHRKKGLGEPVSAEDYRAVLGDRFQELLDVLEAESAIDDIVDPQNDPFPRLFGEYTLLRELGRGAMGVVYEAVHRQLGRKVAIKVLRTGFDTEREAIERFRREARACAQVKHRHIVEIYDAGQVDDRPYYSMELLEGQALDSLVHNAAERITPEALCAGMVGVADALATLHDAGIIHRDVKPSNIMVKPDGTMVLADFGLARTVDSERLTATGQALGTPLYMSPEQVLGKASEITGAADIYGLGASIYEVLAERKLFDTDGMPSLLRAILNERPVPLRQHRPDLSRDFDHVIMKTLEKEQADRYGSAHELAAELRRLAAGEAVEGRAVSSTLHALRRGRAYLPLAAALLVAASLGGWYLVDSAQDRVKEEIETAQAVAEVSVSVKCLPGADVTKGPQGVHELTLRPGGLLELDLPHPPPAELGRLTIGRRDGGPLLEGGALLVRVEARDGLQLGPLAPGSHEFVVRAGEAVLGEVSAVVAAGTTETLVIPRLRPTR